MADETPIYSVTLDAVNAMMGRLTQNMDEQRRFRDDMQLYFQHQSRIDRARNEQLKKSGSLWKNIKSSADDTYKIMLKMGKLGIGVGGGALGLGVAGVYGYGRMAAGVGDERRQAMGLGSTIGQMKSFETNMKRIFKDPLAFLSGAQSIASNPKESFRLRKLTGMAGIGDDEYINTPIADLMVKVLPKMKEIADSLDEVAMKQIDDQNFRNAIGLGTLTSDEVRALKAVKKEEPLEMQKTYFAGKASMDMVDENARKLQETSRQFDEILTNIAQSFKNNVAPLAKPLGDLAKASEHAITDMIKSGSALKAVEGAADGLETVLKYIGSPEFQTDMDLFVQGISDLAPVLYKIAHPLETMDKEFFNQGVYDSDVSVLPKNNDMMQAAIAAVRQFESSNNPLAISPTGPVGSMQVTRDVIAKYFPDQISKDANSPHYFPGTDTPNWKEHRTNWLKAHKGVDVKAGEMELAHILSKGGFYEHPEKLGQLWREKYNTEKNSPQADKMARDIQFEFNKSLPKLTEKSMFSLNPMETGKNLGSWAYDSGMDDIKDYFSKKWDYLTGQDEITKKQDESTKKYLESLKKDEYKTQRWPTNNDQTSYNINRNDVKRIELGVKVGSRPGGDVFGQAVAMS